MLIEHDYKGFRVSADAVCVGDAWDAEVRITRLFTYGQEKPHVEILTARKATSQEAQERGLIYDLKCVNRQTGHSWCETG